ncbi:MAG: hypothetical protein Q9184_006978 [Pyrenodesmia sp. 2 TL-2023]
MCHLISALKPRDVYPCVADKENWASGSTIRNLFGRLCSGNSFAYDDEMLLGENINSYLPPSYRSPEQCSLRDEASPPAQVGMIPETGLDSLGGRSASLRPQFTRVTPSGITPGSATQRKREVTFRARPRKRTQKEFAGHAFENDRVLRSSFSGWIKASNVEPAGPSCARAKPVEGSAQDVLGEAGTPDVMTMAGGSGRGDEPPLDSTNPFWRESASDDTAHPKLTKDADSAVKFHHTSA